MRIWFTTGSCLLGFLSSPAFNGGEYNWGFLGASAIQALLAIAWRPK